MAGGQSGQSRVTQPSTNTTMYQPGLVWERANGQAQVLEAEPRTYVCVYIYRERERCVCVYIYIYTYIYRERYVYVYIYIYVLVY